MFLFLSYHAGTLILAGCAQKSFWETIPPRKNFATSRPPKDTFLCQTALFEPSSVHVGRRVRPVHDTKKHITKNKSFVQFHHIEQTKSLKRSQWILFFQHVLEYSSLVLSVVSIDQGVFSRLTCERWLLILEAYIAHRTLYSANANSEIAPSNLNINKHILFRHMNLVYLRKCNFLSFNRFVSLNASYEHVHSCMQCMLSHQGASCLSWHYSDSSQPRCRPIAWLKSINSTYFSRDGQQSSATKNFRSLTLLHASLLRETWHTCVAKKTCLWTDLAVGSPRKSSSTVML